MLDLEEEGLCLIFVTCLFLLGAGADFVMMGGMFAGHDQSGMDCLIFTDVLIIKLFLLPYLHFKMTCGNSKHFRSKMSLIYYDSKLNFIQKHAMACLCLGYSVVVR